MGNQIIDCCRNCINLQPQQFILQTRYLQIQGDFKKPLRCRKFYISSEPIAKQKINQLLIFTDSSLTMTIPNFNLKFKDDQLQKLQQAVKYQIYNNNLVIKQNCFILNAIPQQVDSQYEEFKDFPEKTQVGQQEDNQKERLQSNDNSKQQLQHNHVEENQSLKKEKMKNEIELFTMRNKSRAFRFKNPLKNYQIGQIIVAIVPVFQKPTDLQILKEAIEQGLSMCEDMRSVGVSQISFMLGYQQSLFQKIILQYILGYSKSKKAYVFKKMSNFVYLSRSNEQISNFFNLLNIYTKSNIKKNESRETLGSQQQKNSNNIRKLGAHSNLIKKVGQNKPALKLQNNPTTSIANNNNTSSILNQNIKQSSFISNSNTSFQSFNNSQSFNLGKVNREKPLQSNNINTHMSLSRSSSLNAQFGINLGDISQIKSINNSESSEVKNIRIKSFRSKESNVSDYF